MELTKHMEASREVIKAVSSSIAPSESAAQLALNRIRSDIQLQDLAKFVPLEAAQECEKFLEGAREISVEGRQRAAQIVRFLMDVENKCKSQSQMLSELKIPDDRFRQIEYYWPGFWPFVTLVSTTYLHAANYARIVQSTVDAAVNGNHQDRRLYYEAFRGLRQKGEGGGNKTFVFINDSVARPAERSVDVQSVEVLPEAFTSGDEEL